MRIIVDRGSARSIKSSNERPLRAAINIPIGLPSTVEADPILVAIIADITNGTGVIVRILQRSNITVVITIIELISPINPDNAADNTIITINNTVPFNFLILQNTITNQWNTPASFIIPTIIIMAMRKIITSREANFIKFSRFTARMRISIQLPINTKLSLKSQKKSVPKIEREKMAITRD